jgi:predicted flap endonuclease-1-like 5' DNA nuclease
MTYLLLQTFLLLLASYFLGAFLACLTKRLVTRRAERAAAIPRATLAPAATRPAAPLVAAKPRTIDPVQPKIDILPRPEPKAAPAQTKMDTSRFDRALALPDPNEGMPRKSVVEIRPAILKSPTGPAVPFKPKPVAVEAPKPAPAPQVKPAASIVTPAPQKTSVPVTGAVQPQSQTQSMGTAAATANAAAAAAVAAAQAAASAAVARPVAQAPAPAPATVVKAPEPPRPSPAPAPPVQAAPVVTKPEPAAPQPAPQPIAGGDDLQRIRAIDADTERRLQGIGVRRFDDIARWTPADINRVNQALGLTGRIDREQWIEQAQILAKGGETYYSRNRAAAVRGDAPTPTPAPSSAPAPASSPAPSAAQQAVTAAAAAAAAAASSKPATAAPQQPVAAPQTSAQIAPAQTVPSQSSSANALQGRSVAEMASAAAAAIAAASASVTRGIRPIEPISPMSRANPNVSMPAKLSDAIKDKAVPSQPAAKAPAPPQPKSDTADADDLKRIRGIGVLIEKRLNALDVHTYDAIANWTSGDIDRISQQLDFKGRIERENWVEQARILSSGGHTEFSRRVDRGDVETSKDPDAT